MDEKIIALLSKLKHEFVFYGTVGNINKDNLDYIINVDLFNEITDELDDLLNDFQLDNFVYTFEMIIKTLNLSIFNNKKELLCFEIINDDTLHHNHYEAFIWLNLNRKFDKINPFNYKKVKIQVTKASSDIKRKYQNRLNKYYNYLKTKWQIKKHININIPDERHKKNPKVYYRQYHVGAGNCSYINIDGVTRGFFNIGFSHFIKGTSFPYYGFSRHKPDWIIISNLHINNYRAAIRYGNIDILSCEWIMPYVDEVNINMIRLFWGILNNKGKISLLRYKANSSVVSMNVDNVNLELYFTSTSDMKKNGLCLYLEKEGKFISLGNSDYNFMTKLLIPQKFDILVLPSKLSKIKTKIFLNRKGRYKVYRIDIKGTFKCSF